MISTSEALMSGGPREEAGSRAPDWQEKAWVLGSFKSSIRLCPCANLFWDSWGKQIQILVGWRASQCP